MSPCYYRTAGGLSTPSREELWLRDTTSVMMGWRLLVACLQHPSESELLSGEGKAKFHLALLGAAPEKQRLVITL